MDIKEQTGKLTIECDPWPWLNRVFGSLFQYIVVAVMLTVAATRASKTLGIIVFFLALFGLWIVAAISGEEAVFHCLLDRERQMATLTYRAPWSMWRPSRERIPLKQITAVLFSKTEKDEPKLSFAQTSDDPINLAGGATAKAAERISRFLRIPLRIELGDERITHIPWSANGTASLVSTPCASCGALLPPIQPGMKSIKCEHCGMNMIIQWQEDEFSYRKQTEFDM